jgi:2-polyprenyl-3-methyl-5-hydroxy-6-metoxy-1,4-benzoquinol methylase
MLQESDHYEKGKFINDLVGHLKPFKESRILQSTCGTGGLSKVMVDAGFDVTAIDYSFEAINKAKQFENEKLRFFQHDVRLPFWINYFNYAFNLFTSFGYFNTLREHNNSMRTISQSLVPDGILVIDTDNVHYKEDNLQKNQKKIINDLQLSFTEWQDNEKFYKKIELEEHGSTKELYTEKFLKYSIGDFTDMLAYQGLQIQEVFGDYGFSHYNIRTSPRLILIAKKIGR